LHFKGTSRPLALSKMNDIETNVKKVFKSEYAVLENSRKMAMRQDLSKERLIREYEKLLESYRLLLKDAVKITTIGDINQKKLYESHEEIDRQKKTFYQASITDSLTKIFNRAYLMEVMHAEFAKNLRYAAPLSSILLDVDNFKRVNDTYGHLMGDAVLRKVAETIKPIIRQVDTFGRYGGEEFMVILPNTTAADAALVAEKIRKKVADTAFGEKQQPLYITLSLGVTDTSSGSPETVDEFIYNTDKALYVAKRQGKNRYVQFQAGND
jgi:diguanylate cyclase (GGDEF)-like protein